MTHIYINSEALYFIGDIHGNFESINTFIKTRDIHNATLFFCGDCGFGFMSQEYYEKQVFPRLKKTLSRYNDYCIFVRGNHDDPSIFNSFTYNYKRIKAVPDYTVISVHQNSNKTSPCKNILCVGGAISIDRSYRIKKMKESWSINPCYWADEICVFNATVCNKLKESGINIDVVVSHSCPLFCDPPLARTAGIGSWITAEKFANLEELTGRDLMEDVRVERVSLSNLYDCLIDNKSTLECWFYGHYHFHNTMRVNSTTFCLLDMERNGILDAHELVLH